jgi:hypothetical protein
MVDKDKSSTLTAALKRDGQSLVVVVTIDGQNSPEQKVDLSQASGPIDFKFQSKEKMLDVSWRRSDRGETWNSLRAMGWNAGAAIPLSAAYLKVEQQNAVPGQPILTFGKPLVSPRPGEEFAPLSDDHPLVVLRPYPLASNSRDGNAGMIASAVERVCLGIRPPATDVRCWSRWIAMDLYLQNGKWTLPVRKEVLTRYYQLVWQRDQSSKARRPAGTEAEYDLTLDDPAVEGHIIELVPLLVESRVTVEKRFVPLKSAALPATGSGMKLPHVQTRPTLFEVFVEPSDKPEARSRLTSADPISGVTQILVREKEIWELRVYAAVRDEFFERSDVPGEQRFHSNFGGTEACPDPSFRCYRLFAPLRLCIEVATREVMSADNATLKIDTHALQEEFHKSLVATFDGARVTVDLDKQKVTKSPRRYRYVSHVRLFRQIWRWQGRPTPLFPFELALQQSDRGNAFPAKQPEREPDPTSNLMLWDAVGFGDRDGLDLIEETRPVSYERALTRLFSEDLTGDPRALYYRFAAVAVSRYAGLYPAYRPTLFALTPRPHDLTEGTAWTRLVVPCRPAEKLPPPAVKFVVPLTQLEEDQPSAKVPGVLVVLEEGSFIHGGLAESIEAEIATVTDPTAGKKTRPEFGPDPILTGKGWTKENGDPRQDSLSLEMAGPIGHTFDAIGDAKLFGSSTWILRPPEVDLPKQTMAPPIEPPSSFPSLAWFFAKLRFRRLLRPEGIGDYYPLSQKITESKDFVLDPQITREADRVATIADIHLRGNGTLEVKFLNVAGVTRTTVLLVEAEISDRESTFRLLDPYTVATLVSGKTPSLLMDLRFTFQVEAAPGQTGGAEGKTPPGIHLAINYRLRTPSSGVQPKHPGVWRLLKSFYWPETTPLPSNVFVRWSGSEQPSYREPRVFAARLSQFTAPYWVQFLPDSDELLTTVRTDDQIVWDDKLDGFKIEQLKDGKYVVQDDAWKLESVVSTEKILSHSMNSFFRRVLLTQVVRDVRMQTGQERYLGLYEINRDANNLVECIHRSPALAKDEYARDLSKVRIRIVEFQSVDGVSPPPVPRVKPAPWDGLFRADLTVDDGRDADVAARIVRVSRPMDIVARCANKLPSPLQPAMPGG